MNFAKVFVFFAAFAAATLFCVDFLEDYDINKQETFLCENEIVKFSHTIRSRTKRDSASVALVDSMGQEFAAGGEEAEIMAKEAIREEFYKVSYELTVSYNRSGREVLRTYKLVRWEPINLEVPLDNLEPAKPDPARAGLGLAGFLFTKLSTEKII